MMIICRTEQPKTWHSAGVRKRTSSLAIDIALRLEWEVATWRSLLQEGWCAGDLLSRSLSVRLIAPYVCGEDGPSR